MIDERKNRDGAPVSVDRPGGRRRPGRPHQQPAERPKDKALDDLLEKLSQPSNGPAAKAGKSTKSEASPKKAEPKAADSDSKAKGKPADSSKASTGTAPDGAKPQKPAADKPAAPKPGGPAKVSDKDQELDDLLQKLGETKDEPSPDDRPRGGGGENKPGPQPPGGGKAEPDKLTGKDKETDEHLEELTGRRRKRKQDDGQRTGEVGEMIKEMRDVEEKLGKPDPGEATREQQKKIVKRIETMIEQAKRSGGQMGRMTRMVRQQGQQRQGQQQGQTVHWPVAPVRRSRSPRPASTPPPAARTSGDTCPPSSVRRSRTNPMKSP